MSHDTLVFIAKTFGLIWLLGFFLIVVVRAYRPSARAAQDRAARSILPPEPEDKA
ncbi:cbb3-type cytochrome c oxidase subunit 3 [Hoeflea sp.]|jgi:cytochrome c oxidase cbb3-type subunit 4|uniref:cbb3-type cytochrome c oxidase subunit 3 n=1 Tax=Hoeflea sp. TaxID=1940281 RepID=UPI0019A8560D|nr:cbb3-type cytochrome c oxidase subunit 3 [Hoeflea sp.]MBC7285398.1 cbb3-type cytochrome c oxidase subunit 3 [Hoeflea sp.]